MSNSLSDLKEVQKEIYKHKKQHQAASLSGRRVEGLQSKQGKRLSFKKIVYTNSGCELFSPNREREVLGGGQYNVSILSGNGSDQNNYVASCIILQLFIL